MKSKLWFLLFLVVSCSKDEVDPSLFSAKFHPVQWQYYQWVDNSFFTADSISIRLENKRGPGYFEALRVGSTKITLDRDLILNGDTVLHGENLLPHKIAEIELFNKSLNNEPYPDSYILWINRRQKFHFGSNRGYFTVYIEALTEHDFTIHDSAVVFVR